MRFSELSNSAIVESGEGVNGFGGNPILTFFQKFLGLYAFLISFRFFFIINILLKSAYFALFL